MLLQFLLFVIFVAGSHDAFVRLRKPTTTDFSSFYAAGRLADQGRAADAYRVPAHRRMEEAVTAPGIDYKYFLNPPPFLLVCAPLAALPYLLAFVLFEAATFVLWLAIGTRVAGGGREAALCLTAVPAVWWALGWGQNSFLTAALMGTGTLLLRRRPFLAGLAFGALVIKPHFGILLPLALLCARQWRAMAGAALSAAGLCGASALLFGVASWRAFLDMALHARGTIESNAIPFVGHIDPGGAARLLGASASTGWAIQAVCTAAAAMGVALVWLRRRTGQPGEREARLAVLVAGGLLAMPFLLFYDLVMASLAAAWLVAAARRTRWRGGERAGLVVAALLSFAAFPAAEWLHVPVGALAVPLLLGLAMRRALQGPVGAG